MVIMHGGNNGLPYSRKIWRGFKFGGLAVGVETAELKSANIMLAAPTMRNLIHAVALLAPSDAHFRKLYVLLACR